MLVIVVVTRQECSVKFQLGRHSATYMFFRTHSPFKWFVKDFMDLKYLETSHILYLEIQNV